MIRRLRANGFRNLDALEWAPSPGVHFLFGDTGQGKTSLLEALYVACTTRSFRTSSLAPCLARSRGSDAPTTLWLQAEVEEPDSGVVRQLEISWSREQGLQRRLDGVLGAPLVDHLAVQPLVNWSSADLETLVGPPELRRRLLDRGVISHRPGSLLHFSTLRQALGQKRALLRGGRATPDLLRPWNELIAGPAVEVVARRRRYVERLQQHLDRATDEIVPGWGRLELSYRPSLDFSDVELALRALQDDAREEIRRSRPLLGPHRDRVSFHWYGSPVAEMASAGERKVLGLIVTLCQVRALREEGREPVLLLDDLDVEMDQHLLSALTPLLAATSQTFVTSNRPAAFEGLLERLESPADSGDRDACAAPSGDCDTRSEQTGVRASSSPPSWSSWKVSEGHFNPL